MLFQVVSKPRNRESRKFYISNWALVAYEKDLSLQWSGSRSIRAITDIVASGNLPTAAPG